MYDTDNRRQDGYCLLYYVRDNIVKYYEPYMRAHQIIPYCLRLLEDDIVIEDFNFNNTIDPQFTFAELQEKNVTSLLLLSWSASIDLVERYEIYLNTVSNSTGLSSEKETLFYNCTLPWFGPLCRFASDSAIQESIDKMVTEHFTVKRDSKKDNQITCYKHLNCETSRLCLDWREICDGKIDCSDGSDEFNCWKLEINECAKNEYRCYNGQCILEEFLRDVSLNPDCLDRTDERLDRTNPSPCFRDPAFRCEEHACRPGIADFPCGDGQCTESVIICRNGRNNGLFNDLCSRSLMCFMNNYESAVVSWCHKFCTKGDCVKDNCPSLYQFLPSSILFGHIRWMFTNETMDNEKLVMPPNYVCYHGKLCMDFLPPTVNLNNMTCRHLNELGLNSFEIHVSLRVFIEQIKVRFRKCLAVSNEMLDCKHSTMYQCKNSTKCITKHRLVDGIRDCPFDDDETFIQSCSLSDSHQRFTCVVGDIKKCFASLTIQDGKWDCRYKEDEREKEDKVTADHIYFQTICDGKRELSAILIDGQNETDETQCEHWPCNNTYTRCDHFWLCKNGADEINCPPSDCPQFEHSCVFPNDTSKVSCLPIARTGDGIVDCLGATDERNHCERISLTSHSYGFRCWNHTKCISDVALCNFNEDCPLGDDETFCRKQHWHPAFLCAPYERVSGAEVNNFLCHSTSRVDRPRMIYFNLHNMPPHPTQIRTDTTSLVPLVRTEHWSIQYNPVLDMRDTDENRCNRGLPFFIRMDTSSSEFNCLCPPSYYGNQCQNQNQRVSLTLQIRATSDWRNVFAFIITLIDNEGNIEMHDQIEYLPIRDCDTKFNVYLLYSTRPKNRSRNYSVHIDAFNRLTFKYRSSWIFPLRFPFLPVHRLSVLLIIPFSDVGPLQKCTPPGIHGQCFNYVNDQTSTFWRCEPGWSGPQCTHKYTCNCAPHSLCIDDSICLCPLSRYGPRCYLRQSSCSSLSCQNDGQCVPRDERYLSVSLKRSTCICGKENWGDRCEQQQTRIEISFHKKLKIPLSLLIHFITVRNQAEHIRTTTMKKIGLDQNSLTLYTSVTFNIAFAEIFNRSYLIILHEKPIVSANISTQITPYQQCVPIHDLFNATFVSQHLLIRIKYYHIPCQNRLNLVCFYDNIHFCLCDLSRNANCFEFDHNMTYNCRSYNFCENGGQCFQDDKKCPTSSICVCEQCYYGSRCQFSTKGSTLSLDTILGYRIHPNVGITQQPTVVKTIIVLTILMLCLSFISNFFAVLTFRTKEARLVGCGVYLLASSITSMITMSVFTIKFWVLLASQMNSINNRSFLNAQCVTIDFFLRFLLSTGDWLNACVAIERAVNVLKGINFPKLKSKRIAKTMIFLVFLFTMSTHIHDPIHRQLVDDEEEGRIWCVTKYSSSLQIFDWAVNIIHFSVPFLINCISALVIIITAARIRLVAQGKGSYKKLLQQQFKHHKHLLISPGILIVLSFPRLFISFLSGCMKSTRDFWFYLTGYFISFIPSMLIFIVFVLPSEMYKKEFSESIKRFWR